MKRAKRILSSLLMACLLMMLMSPAAAYGASAISSVTIRVGLNDFIPGDTLPDIVIGDRDSADCAYVYVSSSYYSVESAQWVTSENKAIKVGDTPRMRVRLEPTDADTRRFKGGYYSSNVKINGGTFKSATVSSGDLIVTLDLDPVKGEYDMPEEAYWANSGYGMARWKVNSQDSSSGYYEVALYRGSSQVHKTETSGTSYNFYPYMTKKGSYYFKVRTIPRESQDYGKRSDWAVSDEVYVPEEDVSDGSGRKDENAPSSGNAAPGGLTPSGGNVNVGWVQSGNRWYFRYPDGTCPKDEWLSWNGKWYLFDSEGWMLTGWQNKNGYTYYLDSSGAMITGWVQAGNIFYYLNPTPDQYEGILVKNHWLLQDGNYYYLNDAGIRAEGWLQVNGNWHYFYPGTGVMAVNTFIDGFRINENGIWVK